MSAVSLNGQQATSASARVQLGSAGMRGTRTVTSESFTALKTEPVGSPMSAPLRPGSGGIATSCGPGALPITINVNNA